jgi:hypothetical protein
MRTAIRNEFYESKKFITHYGRHMTAIYTFAYVCFVGMAEVIRE